MIRTISFFILLSVSLTAQKSSTYIPIHYDQWLVKLDDQGFDDLVNTDESSLNIEVISTRLKMINVINIESVAKSEIESLLAGHTILDIYPNYRLEQRDKIPDDFHYSNQWNMDLISMPQVWEFSTGGKAFNGDDLVVAVLDIGYELDHVDLQENLWNNINEIPGDGIDNDNNGVKDDYLGMNVDTQNDNHYIDSHGTKVAGIIGAKGNNGRGISGVNWDIKIMPIGGVDMIGKIIVGMEYVIMMKQKYLETNGAEGANIVVTNLSAGVPDKFPADSFDWCDLYDAAGNVGILSVSAAPNAFVNVDIEGDLPTLCESDFLITVTSTDQTDFKVREAGYSNKHVDLGAPGEKVFTTTIGDDYSTISGTSGSAPHVAGVVALLYSAECENFSDLVKEDQVMAARLVKDAIMGSVDTNTSLGSTLSRGRLNAYNAFIKIANWCTDRKVTNLEINNIQYSENTQSIEVGYATDIFSEHQILLFDMTGRLLYTQDFIPDLFNDIDLIVDLSQIYLGSGNYLLSITNESNKVSELITIVK